MFIIKGTFTKDKLGDEHKNTLVPILESVKQSRQKWAGEYLCHVKLH